MKLRLRWVLIAAAVLILAAAIFYPKAIAPVVAALVAAVSWVIRKGRALLVEFGIIEGEGDRWEPLPDELHKIVVFPPGDGAAETVGLGDHTAAEVRAVAYIPGRRLRVEVLP